MAANWDSLVFDTGESHLKRIPMMEPLRGDRSRVGALLDSVDDAAALIAASRRTLMAEREQSSPLERAPRTPKSTKRLCPPSGPPIEKLDELLDEIDQVLEENAEEFVRNYIQKGGE